MQGLREAKGGGETIELNRRFGEVLSGDRQEG